MKLGKLATSIHAVPVVAAIAVARSPMWIPVTKTLLGEIMQFHNLYCPLSLGCSKKNYKAFQTISTYQILDHYRLPNYSLKTILTLVAKVRVHV